MILSTHLGRRLRQALLGLAALAALAGCGGGTSAYETFVPLRLFAFGDELSAFGPGGQKYTINDGTTSVDANGITVIAVDCTLQPIWVQSLAAVYGFVFPECNPSGTDDTRAKSYASAGAKVEDVKVQIDAQIANGGFREKDLVTVLAGANDVLELYAQFPGRDEADLANELRARGKRLAGEVNRLVDLGTRVILATVPDMGVTPFARKQDLEFPGTGRSGLLTRLTAAFNEQLGVNILLDGHFIGLVQADLRVQLMARSPASFGLANVTDAACLDTAPLPGCSTITLVDGAATNWMWADDFWLGPVGHGQLASLAIDRARRNPF